MFLVICLALDLLATVRAADILVLTDENFSEAIKENEFILVEFYAPWCGHCKELAPEYAKAARELAESESPVKLAKVDATEQSDLAQQYGVRGYPTIIFFKNGTPEEYSGGRKAKDIVAWVTRQTGPPATSLDTIDAAKVFSEQADVVVIGYFEDLESQEAKSYTTAADTIEEPIPFGITNVKEVMEGMEASPNTIVMYKKFDDGKAVYTGELETGAIIEFILAEQLPLVSKFSDATAPKIFGGNVRSHLLAFFASDDERYQEYMASLGSAAKEYKGKVLFVHVDSSEDESTRAMDFFKIEENMVPTIRLINLAEGMKRYVPDFTEIDSQKITSFVQKYLDGELSPHLITEEIPDDWDQNEVKVLVGKNFNNIAFDRSKHVFVEFYAPWCGHCHKLAPIWEELAEHFKDDNEVLIAKMDSTKNEVEQVSIKGFPTLKFFPKDSDEIVDYNGSRTLDDLIQFVKDQIAGITEDDAAGSKDEL